MRRRSNREPTPANARRHCGGKLPRSEGIRLFGLRLHEHKRRIPGPVGIVGYEVTFNRYLYEYPPRPLEEIEADIQTVEKEIVAMLREVAG